MRITELFLDPTDSGTVHASMTCERNTALVELAESHRGAPIVDLDDWMTAVASLGYLVPVWSTRGMHHCEHCTLVATTTWAVAA